MFSAQLESFWFMKNGLACSKKTNILVLAIPNATAAIYRFLICGNRLPLLHEHILVSSRLINISLTGGANILHGARAFTGLIAVAPNMVVDICLLA